MDIFSEIVCRVGTSRGDVTLTLAGDRQPAVTITDYQLSQAGVWAGPRWLHFCTVGLSGDIKSVLDIPYCKHYIVLIHHTASIATS